MHKNCSECQKQFLYTTCSPQVWAWNFHVLNLEFNEQSVVILWVRCSLVRWYKNKSFWQIFTCIRILLNGEKMLYKSNYFSVQLKITTPPTLALKTKYCPCTCLAYWYVQGKKQTTFLFFLSFLKVLCHVQKAWWHVLKINQLVWMLLKLFCLVTDFKSFLLIDIRKTNTYMF